MYSSGLPGELWEEAWTLSFGLSATVPEGSNLATGVGDVVPC